VRQGVVAGRWLIVFGLLVLSGCRSFSVRRGETNSLAEARAAQTRELSERAQSAIDHGQYDQARAELEQMLQLSPNSPEALYRLGTVFQHEGRLAEAESSFRRALARDPEYVLAMVGLGEVETARGDYANALKRLEAAVELDPSQSRAHHALGRLLEKMGRNDAALAEYFRALESEPNNSAVILRIASIQLARNQADQALSRLNQVVEMTPDDAQARDVRGLAYLRLGLVPEAVADFRASLANQPNQPDVLYHLAVALEHLGKTAEARRTVAILLKLKPSQPEVRALAERLALLPTHADKASPRTYPLNSPPDSGNPSGYNQR